MASIPGTVPSSVRSQIVGGTWQAGGVDANWDPEFLDAKMKGVRAVFIMLVPLMAICLLDRYCVPDLSLRGDRQGTEQKDDRVPAAAGAAKV